MGFFNGLVKKYSSRRVPVQSRSQTQRTSPRSWPLLYQYPVPVTTPTRRVVPPYQVTLGLRRRKRRTFAGETSRW